ncbi:hypothetical protein HDU77_010287 [Chytriomyces hyalinus]|nr:hypothetical protein HDU77_010287 [Chytriomyces hyalinus]
MPPKKARLSTPPDQQPMVLTAGAQMPSAPGSDDIPATVPAAPTAMTAPSTAATTPSVASAATGADPAVPLTSRRGTIHPIQSSSLPVMQASIRPLVQIRPAGAANHLTANHLTANHLTANHLTANHVIANQVAGPLAAWQIGRPPLQTPSMARPPLQTPSMARPAIQSAAQQNVGSSVTRSRVAWDKDGVPPANRSSISILLDWICNIENYKRWKGSGGTGGTGIKRETLCSEVVQLMRGAGILHRDNNKVGSKIRELEMQYKNAIDWLSGTGEGILDSAEISHDDKEGCIRKGILKRCPYYDVLDPVMSDRASSRPFATNEDGVYDPFQGRTPVALEQQNIDRNDSDDEFALPELPSFSAGPASTSSTIATDVPATGTPTTTSSTPGTPAPATPASIPSTAAISAAKRKKTAAEVFESTFERSQELERLRMKAEQDRFEARMKIEQERFELEKKRLEAAAEEALAEAMLKKIAAAEKRFAARQRFIDGGMTPEDADKMFQ